MNIPVGILQEAVESRHGELKALAERYGYNYHTFRKAVSEYERGLSGPTLRDDLEREGAHDILRQIAAQQPRQHDLDDAWERARREVVGEVPQVPENINLIDAPPLTLDYTTWAYCSDLHVPLHSRLFVERLAKVMRYHRVRNLVIGGDLADYDMLSRFPKAQRVAEWKKASRIIGDMILYLAEYVDELVVVPGNHDRRIQNKLDQPYSMEDILGQALGLRQRPRCSILTTEHDYIYIGRSHEDPLKAGWVGGHPRFFSSTPAKGMADVADRVSRNTIGSHNHLVGLMKSRRGYTAIDPGCMCSAELTPYHVTSDGLSRYGNWQQGYVLILDGYPQLFADGLTDWRRVCAS